MSEILTVIITSIQKPTPCVEALASRLKPLGASLIIIADRKGPFEYSVPTTELVSLEQQLCLPFKLARLLPTDHYVRKNIGYLLAISRSSQCIYETDDDNMPGVTWRLRTIQTAAQRVKHNRWINVFRIFSDKLIWPRGFPLDLITDPSTHVHDRSAPVETFNAPIQQGLADNSPDVDAIWRLTLDSEFQFDSGPSVRLQPGSWCPFNSQSTWWWPPAYPLMYLPSHCTFRMTDIWRSFVAQRCLWELDSGLVFHSKEVVQERNDHRLMNDFEDEIPGYLHNRNIINILENIKLESGTGAVADNLIRCYEALISAGIFPAVEMEFVLAWLSDLEGINTRLHALD